MKIYISAVEGANSFYDRVISWYSRSKVVHVEFHWPLTERNPAAYFGAQPVGGVQVRPVGYLPNAKRRVYSVDMTPNSIHALTLWLEAERGKPYDFKAIAGMAFPSLDKGQVDDAWFCSELVFYGLLYCGKPLLAIPSNKADRVTPRDVVISTLLTREA